MRICVNYFFFTLSLQILRQNKNPTAVDQGIIYNILINGRMTSVKCIIALFCFCFVFTFVNINYQISKKTIQKQRIEELNQKKNINIERLRNYNILKLLGSLPQKKMKIPPILWMTSKNPLNMSNYEGFSLRWHDNDALYESMKAMDIELTKLGIVGAYQAFDNLIPWAYKADLWRYCVLYLYGGVYADHEVVFIQPLTSIVRNMTNNSSETFAVCSDTQARGGVPNKYWQGFLISEQFSLAMRRAIVLLLQNVLACKYTSNPLDVTGPGLFTKAVPYYTSMCVKLGIGNGMIAYNTGTHIIDLNGEKERSPYNDHWINHDIYKRTSQCSMSHSELWELVAANQRSRLRLRQRLQKKQRPEIESCDNALIQFKNKCLTEPRAHDFSSTLCERVVKYILTYCDV